VLVVEVALGLQAAPPVEGEYIMLVGGPSMYQWEKYKAVPPIIVGKLCARCASSHGTVAQRVRPGREDHVADLPQAMKTAENKSTRI